MPSVPIELGPFTEGVNLVDPLGKLSPRELSKCTNYRRGVAGEVYKRPGHDNYGSSPANINGNNLVNLLLRYYKADGSKLLIGAAGGLLKFGNDSTGAWTNISINGTGASMHSSNLCDWMVYKNRLYITDGTNPQRYNGTDNIYAGHFIPAAPTLAQSTGGSLTLLGAYKYFVTSVAGDMGQGSKGSEVTITLTGTNNRVTLTNINDAAAKYEETAKRIYRTKAGGSTFFFLTEIAEGVTSYVDNIADSALDTAYVSTHAPRADARFVIMGHDDRAYWYGRSGINASIVEVSDVGFPDRIIDTEFFAVANNDNDIITGAGLVPGGILFLKKNSAWLLRAFGYGLINIQPREKRGSGIGTTSPFSCVTTPVGLIFVSQLKEVYLFDGTNIKEIGRKISSEFRGMTQSAMGRIVAAYHDHRYILSYDYRGQKGYNWKTLEYNIITDSWDGPHENGDYYNPSYYAVFDSVLDTGELYWGEAKATTGSKVYKRTEFSNLDRGQKFKSTISTGNKSIANLGEVKSIKAFVSGKFSSDAEMFLAHIDEDSGRTEVKLTTPVITSESKYDTAKFGTAKWHSSKNAVLEGPLGSSARARMPRFELTDGGTATKTQIEEIQLLVEALPLK